MSKPLLPPDFWVAGTDPEVPWNDNFLRFLISQHDVNNATTAQPSLTSPADDGKCYIIQSTHTGAQWASFTPKSVAVFYGGGWYEFTPVEGFRISISGASYIYTSGAWTAAGGGGSSSKVIQLACSDEGTALSTGTAKITFRMPYAMTLTDVRASLTTAQASGSIFTVDINQGGTTILSTKLTIDNTEKTSTTAATAPVISNTSLADDAEITIDIDQIGNGTAAGLKVTLIGT